MCTRIEAGAQHHGPMLSHQKLSDVSQNESHAGNSLRQMLFVNSNEQAGAYGNRSHNYAASRQFYTAEKTEITSPSDRNFQSFRKSSSDSAAVCGFSNSGGKASQDNYHPEQEEFEKPFRQETPTQTLHQYHSPPPYDPVVASHAAADFAKFESVVHEMTSNKIDICATSVSGEPIRPDVTSYSRTCSVQKSKRIESVDAKLEMKSLWDEFNELGTEMIVTKAGR